MGTVRRGYADRTFPCGGGLTASRLVKIGLTRDLKSLAIVGELLGQVQVQAIALG